MIAQLGRGFPVLTGKYSTEGTAIQAQTDNDSTAWQRVSGIDWQIQHRRDSYSSTGKH